MNDLLVNTSKTKLLNVSRIPTIFTYVIIDSKLIQPSDSVCNLGVIMVPVWYIIPSGIKQYFSGISAPGYCMVHNSLWHKSVLLWDI